MALHRGLIDYPFGIGAGCYFDESFEVACDDDDSSGSPKALLKSINLTVYPNFWQRQSLCGKRDNRFTAIGCDSYAQQYDSSSPGSGCLSICACDPTQNGTYRCDWSCTILPNRKDQEQVPVVLEWGNDKGSCYEEYNSRTEMCNKDNQCLIQIDSGHFCICDDSSSYASKDLCAGSLICNTTGGINCSECPHGYYPTGSNIENQTKCSNFRKALIFRKRSRDKFIAVGCTVGGLGMLSLLTGTWWLYNFVKRRREIKLKQKFFKRNGGLLLHQELSSDKEGRPFEILDVHVLMEGGKDEIITVTKLAKRCFNLNSKKRPTMTEVVIELAGIRACNGVSNIVQESVEDIDCVDGGIAESSDLDACFTDSSTGSDSVDISMMSIL
ncbi:hypothetical protein WN944_022201 [Citrus x changshan-huyou]|uniref:Uncharacterized protein n=1 Tax=Citrus x changshan-huyou TaxID=2935761 RepID=A0AAP0QVY4_9ROSI